MLNPRISHRGRQKKQMVMEAPSVDRQLELEQSANQSVTVVLFLIHCDEYLTTPLKVATNQVHYL